jgi:hypothetical protein
MTTFKAMTWNVENLFRPEPETEEAERERYRSKLGLLADVIGRLDPDVVALQEVGGEGPLEDLQGALGGSYPHRAVSAFPGGRGIRVVFLSKHAVEESEDIVDFPPGPALDVHDLTASGEATPIDRMGRGALRVRITKDGLTVDLVTAHLKSKLLSFPRLWGTSFTPRDEGERAQVGGIALMRRMAEAEIGTLGFGRPDKGDDARLFNLAPCIPQDRRFSRIERGRPELLDQILASVECFPVEGDGPRLPEADSHVDFRDRLPSVGDDPSEREKDVAPDHAPVTASFDL